MYDNKFCVKVGHGVRTGTPKLKQKTLVTLKP